MSEWQDNYQQASFRGIEFNVGSIRVNGGRRTVIHQYPRGKFTSYEDNGIQYKGFSIDGFYVGKNFWRDWQDLETAFDIGGSALMVHPYRGTLEVWLDKYSAVEVSNSGQYVNFTFNVFLEEVASLAVYKDVVKQIAIAKEALTENADAWLEENYSTNRQPWAVIQDARTTLQESFSGMENAKRTAATGAAFKRAIEDAKGDVIAISLTAEMINNRYEDLISYGLTEVLGDGLTRKDQVRELRQVLTLTRSPLTEMSDDSYTDTNLSKQIQTRLAYATIGAIASLIPEIEFATIEEAEIEQTELFNAIDYLSNETIITDDVYSALRDVRTAVYNYIEDTAVNLPNVIRYKPEQGDNVLSVSYRLYGNIIEADTIAELNGLIHPGFLPQNKEIVLRAIDE